MNKIVKPRLPKKPFKTARIAWLWIARDFEYFAQTGVHAFTDSEGYSATHRGFYEELWFFEWKYKILTTDIRLEMYAQILHELNKSRFCGFLFDELRSERNFNALKRAKLARRFAEEC